MIFNCGSLAVIFQKSFSFVSTLMGLSCAILSPITMSLNALLMVSFIATKQVSLNTTNFLIMCLCLSDFLTGAVPMPVLASVQFSNDDTIRCIGFKTAQVTTGCFTFASVFLTVLIATDRYLNMNPNIERRSRCYKVFQAPYIYYFLAFVTTSMLGLSIVNTLTANVKTRSNVGLLIIVNVILLTTAVCIIAILYIKGYLRIRKFTEASPIYRERNGNATRPQYVRNLYRSVLILVVLMMLIYVPLCITTIAISIDVFIRSSSVNRFAYSMYSLAVLLLYLNCVINALVMLWFNKVANKWVLSKMGSCFSRKDTREAVNISRDIRSAGVAGEPPVAIVMQDR